jgi:hypothetical protein
MKARISQLHRTEAEWLKLKNWVPAAGELIVYDADDKYSYARLKVGDGEKALQDLDFFIDKAALAALQNQRYYELIDAGRITDHVE